MAKDKILKEAKERFKDSEEGLSDNREMALDDIRFSRLGEQWNEKDKAQREKDGRPCLTINRLPAFIRQVVNDARQNSPAIKVHPVDDDSDPELAEIINGVIRNIEATSNSEVAYDNALEDAVTCGMGFFRIDIDYAYDDVFDMDIKIERIPDPLSVYFDPYSREADASDWSFCFVVENVAKEVFKRNYPNADCSDWEGEDSGGWITEDSVRVAEYWTREEVASELLLLSDGTTLKKEQYEKNAQLFAHLDITQQRPCKTFKVMQYLMTGSEILETNDWAGKFIPIVPVFGDEVIVEDERIFQSLIRPAKDAQRNYNYWRTASTEKVALATKAPWIGPTGSFATDRRNWETSNSETHPFLEYDNKGAPPQQTPPSMSDAGSITEALNASDDLKNIMGMQDASLGIAGNETSGRAINARQREGDIATFHFIDNLSRAIRYGGRVILDLIPHIYNEPRVMRIMGYDGEPDTVQVNQEFELDDGMTKMHDLTKGKYDLVVNAGPSFTSKRDEAATQMTELLRSFPQAAPIIGDLVAKNLDWPGADEIAKRLKTLLPPEIQAMEKMEGLPPEAQAAVAQAQQQIQQLTQVLEQGKQLLQQKDEEIKSLELEKKSKQGELAVKSQDSERKFTADMAKIEADKEMLMYKETETNRRAIIDETSSFLKDYLKKYLDSNAQDQQQSIDGVMQGFGVYDNAIQQLNSKIEDMDTKTKVIEIEAPSGGVYRGVVDDDSIEIKAPSGAIYTGNITEH